MRKSSGESRWTDKMYDCVPISGIVDRLRTCKPSKTILINGPKVNTLGPKTKVIH